MCVTPFHFSHSRNVDLEMKILFKNVPPKKKISIQLWSLLLSSSMFVRCFAFSSLSSNSYVLARIICYPYEECNLNNGKNEHMNGTFRKNTIKKGDEMLFFRSIFTQKYGHYKFGEKEREREVAFMSYGLKNEFY